MLLNWIYDNPNWLFVSMSVIASLLAAGAGLLLARRLTDERIRQRHAELTSFTVTTIAVLYSVLLAFIAVATWESFIKATEIIQTEANLAGNLYDDAQGFPEPVATNLHAAVAAYLRAVIDKEWPVQHDGKVSSAGLASLERIQAAVVSIMPGNAAQTVLMQEMLRRVNALGSARGSRLEAVRGHVPALVWFVIIALGALTIGYSCFLKSDGIIGHLAMLGGLTVSLSLVVCLIVELDYPFRGTISVSAQAYRHVLDGFAQH